METLLDIKQNLIKENMSSTVVTVTLLFTQSKNIMLMFYDTILECFADSRMSSGASP